MKFINSNFSTKSLSQNVLDNDLANKDSFKNKILLIKNDFSFKDIQSDKIKENKKQNYFNFNINNLNNKPTDLINQKIIKNLKTNQKEIANDLSKLIQNEKLLNSNSYLQLINNNPNNIDIDKKKIESELKQLNENKKAYINRLDEIKSRIKSLELKYEKQQGIYDKERQDKLNKFLEKQNDVVNNDEYNKRLRKLKNENNKLLANMHNDLEKKLIKKMNEIENNKKKETENKMNLLKKKRDKERKDILKRKNKSVEETLKTSEYMHKKPEIHKYLYQKIKNNFKEKENKIISIENIKRKKIMKPMENNINDMIKNYKEYKNKRNVELKEKTQKLKNSWSERYLLLPVYKSKIQHMLDAEEQKVKIEKENEKEKKKDLKNNQIKYSKKIEEKQMFMMKIFNEKQKNKSFDEDLILRKNNNNNSKHPLMNNINNYCDSIREKLFIKNKSQDNIKQMTNNMKKIIKPSNINKSEEENRSSITKLPSLNDKINLKKYTIKKITNFNKDKADKTTHTQKIGRNNDNISKVKIDKTVQVENLDYKGTNEINKLIEKNGFNERTLELANCKLESIRQRQKEKSLLLKCEGGFEKNPGLGEEVCDLLIDSMTAKLSLLKEMDKIQQNKYKNNLADQGTGPDSKGGIKNLNLNGNKNIEEDEQSNYSSLKKEDEYNFNLNL